MRWALRFLLRFAAFLLGTTVLLLALLFAGLNAAPGRRLIERQTARLSGGTVQLAGLTGRFPDALALGSLELRDAGGTWLALRDLHLDWSPRALFGGTLRIDRLAAAEVDLARLPSGSAAGGGSGSPAGGFSLPLRAELRRLTIGRFALGAKVAGHAAVLAVDGSAEGAGTQGSARLALRRLDGPGSYTVQARLDDKGVAGEVRAEEPAGGLLSALAGLPDLGAIALTATAHGPLSALAVDARLRAGPLRAGATGTVDVTGERADLALTASAPAMAPRPDLAWQSVAVDAKLHGAFTAPVAQGAVRVAGLAAGGATVGSIAADIAGDTGTLKLDATADVIRLPGPAPDLLAAAPLHLSATLRLDAPGRPVAFDLSHTLVSLTGTARTAGALSATAHLTLPDLAPIAGAFGQKLGGQVALDLTAARTGAATDLTARGTLDLTGAPAPLPALLGGTARIDAAASLAGADLTLSRLKLDGAALGLDASGSLRAGIASLAMALDLPDLHLIAPTLAGTARLTGKVTGPTDALAAEADLEGSIAAGGLPAGKITAHLAATGLPARPDASLTARGELAGALLDLALSGRQEADGGFALDIGSAAWKSAAADGSLRLPPGASLPQGTLHLKMDRLEDLRPLLGQPVAGAVTAALTADAAGAQLDLTARRAGLPGTSVGTATLAATVRNPADPVLDARLALQGIEAGGLGGSANLTAKGALNQLGLDLTAGLTGLAGAPAQVQGRGVLDAKARNLALSALTAGWKGETLRLLAPVRVDFANGVTLDRLRLGLRGAVLEAAGRVSPTLDLTASLRDLPAALASVVAPDLAAQGTLGAEARLSGAPARPTGSVTVTARGLRVTRGPAGGLPPVNAQLAATLEGSAARLDLRADAGRSHLAATGRAPLSATGPLDVRTTGTVDLAMLDPLLAASGRRARGEATLDATVTGSASAPRLAGTLRLARGELQDFTQGIRLSGIDALVTAQGDSLRIDRFLAHAGPGTIAVQGSVGVLQPGLPVDLAITARNARPLDTDALSATFGADLTIRGEAAGKSLVASGRVDLQNAELRIPERLPASVAVLDVRVPGQKPPPPAPPGPSIGLDLTIAAPRRIFVRGRGLDAELGGTVKLGGTAKNPQPQGSFNIIRGQFNLAGRTLRFTSGKVGFNGGGLTDPAIDFVATSTNGTTTATLEVTGTANHPKIKLSAVPEAPQDEVLAQLLFGRSASSLSPFELAQIALALGSLTGLTPADADPLSALRQGLGLDQLSVGTGANGSPTLQAGSYVAPGIYVGVQQGTARTGTEATVQVDIAKGLKLEGTTSTGGASATGSSSAGGSSLGITYQFEY
jgi:translocation and assembly module TamB